MHSRIYDGMTFAVAPLPNKRFQIVGIGSAPEQLDELCMVTDPKSYDQAAKIVQTLRDTADDIERMIRGLNAST